MTAETTEHKRRTDHDQCCECERPVADPGTDVDPAADVRLRSTLRADECIKCALDAVNGDQEGSA